ncbi:hypothetical protein Tco_0489432 [Tanacetum coccineum]
MLEGQIADKSKQGLGYSVVPPPHPLIYNRPKKLDLSYSGLDEFKEPEFKGYGSEDSKKESNVVCDKKSDDSKENSDNSLVESVKPKNHEKSVKKSVRYAEMYRLQTPRGNKRNWKGQKSNQLGSDFVMYNKACFICGSFNHVQAQCKYHQRERMVYGNNYNRVNYNYTTKAQAVNTARPKTVKTARLNSVVVNVVRVNQANAIKASACWVWRPTKPNRFVDSGCSRHMAENIAYLSYFKEFDEGYVTFGRGAHSGRISGKGTLKTDSLDFEDVYFVNELKFNLFSVSQMCDKKNYVLFTDTECLVLSPSFKLHDESQNERAATTASSLEAEQDSGTKIPYWECGTPTQGETTSDPSNDTPLSRVTTPWRIGRTVIGLLTTDRHNIVLFRYHCTVILLSTNHAFNSFGYAKANTINGEPQLQAPIDKKKVIIMETSIRSDLHLEDKGVFINQQLGDMSHHKKIYVNPSHINKIFANMRREGKDFSGRVTPLFETMMVQPTQDKGVDSGIPTDSNQIPITTQPSTSISQKKQSRRKQRKDTAVTQEEPQQDDSVPTPSNDPPLSCEDSMHGALMIL